MKTSKDSYRPILALADATFNKSHFVDRQKSRFSQPFTSIFVERMEVMEYRQKFEVELSTFPDSPNTETPRKLVFSLTCVSVCLCEKVCQWISYERVYRFGWKLRCMLQLASNREPPLTSTIGPLFPPNLGRGVICAILWTLISRKPWKISKNRGDLVDVNFQDLKIWFFTFFSISLTVFEIFWKNSLWKKFVRG